MPHVTVADIMRETGLSRATVDRVLNGRGQVHERTRMLVEETFRRLTDPGKARPAGPPVADIALRVGRGMMAQMRAAWTSSGAQGTFHDLHMADEGAVIRCVETLCKDATRPLIVTAKNSDRLMTVLANARAKGKRIIALVSDLNPMARDGFVGLDDRAAGQTAAFLIGRMLGDRPTTVGVVLGNIAFRCHEDREIGFRTGLRAHFPKVVIAAEAQGEDGADLTAAAGRAADMLVVGHEVNPVTVPLLQSAAMDFAIAGDPADMLAKALALAAGTDPLPAVAIHRPFGVYTRFNLPGF